MSTPDPREVAAAVGRLTGKQHIADDVLSGRLAASEVVPLLAGMIDGTIRQLLVPLVGAQVVEHFDPPSRPTVCVVTMLDGSRLTVTLTADR